MSRGRLARWIVRQWRAPSLAGRLLLAPPAAVFRVLVGLRRGAYRLGLRRSRRLPVAVIVVGNLTVGGGGKTPLVVHLVGALRAAGFRPGVVSRGYGGAGGAPRRVDGDSDPAVAGDEPVLIARRCGCPVAVGAGRAAAGALLLGACDVLVADDGLQHYRLARDIEIAVVDGEYGLGNGRLLPAGPLREPASRLRSVDFVAVRDGERAGAWRYRVVPGAARRVDGGPGEQPLSAWHGHRVHAVAGIGVPERFFGQLEDAGLAVERHGFDDHHRFSAADLAFGDAAPILMTEKDAVKCRRIAHAGMWLVPAQVEDRDDLAGAVVRRLRRLRGDGDGSAAA